jgi:hypothetical protein
MPIREAAADDRPRFWLFRHRIVAARETYGRDGPGHI